MSHTDKNTMTMTENCFDSTGHTVPYTQKLYNRAHCLIDMMEQFLPHHEWPQNRARIPRSPWCQNSIAHDMVLQASVSSVDWAPWNCLQCIKWIMVKQKTRTRYTKQLIVHASNKIWTLRLWRHHGHHEFPQSKVSLESVVPEFPRSLEHSEVAFQHWSNESWWNTRKNISTPHPCKQQDIKHNACDVITDTMSGHRARRPKSPWCQNSIPHDMVLQASVSSATRALWSCLSNWSSESWPKNTIRNHQQISTCMQATRISIKHVT